jgi:solute carrier family 35 protein E1
MSTTTVIDTGQHSSVLSLNWQTQMTVSSPVLMASPLDKSPRVDDESPKTTSKQITLLTATPAIGYQPEAQWLPRKNGIELASISKQRPRRSISEAIGSIRARSLSVTVNAQELAEALKAPISYKLIV